MGTPIDEVGAARIFQKIRGDEVHKNLLLASTLLGVFELLRSAVILAPTNVIAPDRVDGRTVISSFVRGKFKPAPSYKVRVMKGDKDAYRAASRWLAKVGVITEEESGTLLAIREHRNDVAHELASYLIDPSRTISTLACVDIHRLLTKVGRWTARRSIEVSSSRPGDEIPDEDIALGSVWIANLIIATLAERTEPRP